MNDRRETILDFIDLYDYIEVTENDDPKSKWGYKYKCKICDCPLDNTDKSSKYHYEHIFEHLYEKEIKDAKRKLDQLLIKSINEQ